MCLQENTKDKKPLELQTSHTPGKLAEARSVFENGASEKSKVSNKKDKLFPPPKPPRVAATDTDSEESPEEQQQAAKRKAPSPPKNAKESICSNVGDQNTTSVIKRKAPEPPTSHQEQSKITCDKSNKGECEKKDAKARNSRLQSSSTDEEGDGSFPPVPTKRERKGSVDSLDGINKAGGDQPTPKPRTKVTNSNEANNKTQEESADKKDKEQDKAQRTLDNTVTIVATPVSSDKRRSKINRAKQQSQEQPYVIQACMVEERNPVVFAKSESSDNIVTVHAVSHDVPGAKRKVCKGEKAKVTTVTETKKHRSTEKVADKVSDHVVAAVAMEKKPPSSSRKTRQSTKKEEFAFKVPKRPTKECHFDPNETVNLNDVNIHEMTFTFDFGQFDQLEKESESIFKMSYEEKCKQVLTAIITF